MNIKIPFIGFIEKTFQLNIVRQFLIVFRDTQDKHRVAVIIPLTLLLSHSYYLYQQPAMIAISRSISRSEILWLGLAGFIVLFMASWAIFSSPFNVSLYVRQGVFVMWTGLVHRLSYGLEVLGTPYFNIIAFIALTSFLPFAFTGLKNGELFSKWKNDYQASQSVKGTISEQAFVEVPKAEKSNVA